MPQYLLIKDIKGKSIKIKIKWLLVIPTTTPNVGPVRDIKAYVKYISDSSARSTFLK